MRDIENLKENVDYEWVELPSKGECYPHKKNRCPIAYLTAKEENLIYSKVPNLIDRLLECTILDDDFKPNNLCIPDKLALTLWLRKTSYRSVLYNPRNNRPFDISTVRFRDFKLKGDENGHFEYVTKDGYSFKFKLITEADVEFLTKKIDEIFGKGNPDESNMVTDIILTKLTTDVNKNMDKVFIKDCVVNMDKSEKTRYFHYIYENIPTFTPFDFTIVIDDTIFTEINLQRNKLIKH